MIKEAHSCHRIKTMTHHNLSIERQKCHQIFMAPPTMCEVGSLVTTFSRLKNKLQENIV